MSARVLVTGGAGFIGSHLVDAIVERGCAVTVLDDLSTGHRENLEEACAESDVRLVEGSVTDPAAVGEAIRDCSQVFHLATQCVRRSIGDPFQSHEVNATGTLTVLEAAREQAVERFVFCSSSEVYGNSGAGPLSEAESVCEPMTVYGAAKLAGECYAKAYHRTYGMPVVMVRPFNAYGPREHDQGDLAEVIPRFVIRVLNGQPPVVFGDGSAGRDFTYVTEVARGLVAAGASEAAVGQTINIAYGRMITIREVAETIARVCQRPDLTPVFDAPRPGDVELLHADTRRARALLGYEATIAFEDGIERYLSWFTRTYPDPSGLLETELRNWTMPGAAAST